MTTRTKSKGTWVHRFAIRLFTVVLAILIFWVLGFFVDDIRSIRGPSYSAIEAKHVDSGLVTRCCNQGRNDLKTPCAICW